MDPFDLRLRDRLVRLEAVAPIGAPPRVADRRTSLRALGALAGATGALVIGGSVLAGVISFGGAQGHPGLFNPGGPLNCSGVEAMTPPAAAAYLAARGYDVTWQIEDVDAHTSHQSKTPPASGHVIEGVLEGSDMTLVVETGAGARPATPPACSR